jgi:molecular chaperone GrpE (heat shock protein)
MKAQLTFNLPEEQEEFNDAINGNAFKAVIWELDQWMRSQLKHEDLPDNVHDKVQEIRDQLHSILNDNNVMYE